MIGKIAYICSNESGNIIIGRLIEENYEVNIVKSKSDIKFLKGLKVIDAIIVHISSNKAFEIELVEQMKKNLGLKDIPIIVLTHNTERDIIVKALEIGAIDILSDLTNSKRIIERIEEIIGVKDNIKDEIYVEKDFILFYFLELVSREVKAASRGRYELSIVSFIPVTEIGLYKAETDKFLNSLKTVVRNSLRETDYVFIQNNYVVAILPFADEKGCSVVIERITSIYQSHPALKPFNTFTTLKSCNVTFPQDGRVVEKLLNKMENDMLSIDKLCV